MGKYLEQNLSKNEVIVKQAKLSGVSIFTGGIFAYFTTELAVTNKNVIGRVGFISKKVMSSPLNKVQNVSVSKRLFGSIFGYGKVKIDTAAGSYSFKYIKKPEEFKKVVFDQMEVFEKEKVKQQAAEMAAAMSGAMQRQ